MSGKGYGSFFVKEKAIDKREIAKVLQERAIGQSCGALQGRQSSAADPQLRSNLCSSRRKTA